jgi:hypothetical protein
MNFIWDVKSINVLPKYNNYKNVVYSVMWVASVIDGEHLVLNEGAVLVDIDNIKFFTDYEKLTKAQVLSWVIDKLGQAEKQKIENKLELLLADQKQLIKIDISPKLPWAIE